MACYPPTHLGVPKLPVGKVKNDEFFGTVETYRDSLSVPVPILSDEKKSIALDVSYQGCADLGVCYPPVSQSVVLDIPAAVQPLAVVAANRMFSTAKSAVTSVLDTVVPSTEEPLPADQAFQLSVTTKDANTLVARWDIQPNYYLYHDKFFIDIEGAEFGDIDFPKGKIKEDELFGQVEAHVERLEVLIPLKNKQSDIVRFTANYQGCWEGGVCYPPQSKTLEVVLKDENAYRVDTVVVDTTTQTLGPISNNLQSTQQGLAASSTYATASAAISSPYDSTAKAVGTSQAMTTATVTNNTGPSTTAALNEADQVTALLQQDNLLWVLASFFGFGLLLSLTPCVFPMIPILSGIIVGQKQTVSTRRAVLMSVVFVLATSVTYAGAGVLAGYFGENLQALLQTPSVLIAFSLIFVALAFSMFGYYDIQLPASLQSKITHISNQQPGGSLIGVIIMGFLSALIVGPCVAPPLAGALIYIGQTGDALLGGLSLFVMSLGMGSP